MFTTGADYPAMGNLLAASNAYGTGRTAGVVAVLVLFAALARQFIWLRNDKSTGLKRLMVIGGIGVLAIVNIGRVAGGGDDNTWESARGADMRARFLDTCSAGYTADVDCDCVFQHLTARPPYDTPDGFAKLLESPDPPAVYVAAYNSCAPPATQPAGGLG